MIFSKQKLIFPLGFLLGCFVLGIFVYASQVNKQRSIEKQQTINLIEERRVEYFKKKIECEEYSVGIKKELESDSDKKSTTALGRLLLSSVGTEVFNFIFYSPKDNSCLYSTQRVKETGEREYFIYNALTKNKITSFQFPEQFNDYKNFILEYSDGEIRL